MKKLPVFVFPVSLQFYLAARQTHKQLLTLYNPYEFPINFQVFCTAPHKFIVTDPEGVIAPQCCLDVAIRYSQPSTAHHNVVDKFRITMKDRSTNQLLGKRDVPATFLLGEPENVVSEERGETFQPIMTKQNSYASKSEHGTCNHPTHRNGTPNAVVIIICSLCVLALLMPTAPISPSPPSSLSAMLPSYWQQKLQLSLHLQLVCAFVLGLLTLTILKP